MDVVTGFVFASVVIGVLAGSLRHTRRSVYWVSALLCVAVLMMLWTYRLGYRLSGPIHWLATAQGLLWGAMPVSVAFAVARRPWEDSPWDNWWEAVGYAAASWLAALFTGFLVFVLVWGL